MKTEVIYYVKRRTKEEFEKCRWTDNIGKKFEDDCLQEMQKSLDALETAMEEAEKFYKKAENVLASVRTE